MLYKECIMSKAINKYKLTVLVVSLGVSACHTARLTSFSSQAHPIGQNREAGVVKEARAGQVHLRGLQSKLVQLLGQQAKLFALAATFLLQISYL